MALREEIWVIVRSEHAVGDYRLFAGLAQAASKAGELELCWWETRVICERCYRVGDQWFNLRPDALAGYHVGWQHLRFWLDWDRDWMSVCDLAIKFSADAHYMASRQWIRESSLLTVLACIAPDIAQARRMIRVALSRLAHASGLVLWTTTEVLLNKYGAGAAIWLQHMPQCSQDVQLGGLLRQVIFATVPEHMMQ